MKKSISLLLIALMCFGLFAGILPAAQAYSMIEINETTFPDENFREWILSNLIYEVGGGRCYLTEDMIHSVTEINCSARNIFSLVGIAYFTDLKRLDCSYNYIKSLDVSNNLRLESLSCSNNKLTDLDLRGTGALRELNCAYNNLENLNLEMASSLNMLDCSNNRLAALDLSRAETLTQLNCAKNQLTALDVRKNTALSQLDCSDNHLAFLDLSMNTWLTGTTLTGQTVSGAKGKLDNGVYTFNMSELVGNVYLSSVSLVSPEHTYDVSSGVVTFSGKVDSFTYLFDTGSNSSYRASEQEVPASQTGSTRGSGEQAMQVTVSLTFTEVVYQYGEPTYEWAKDNSTVTAKRVCITDPNRNETETVSTKQSIAEKPVVGKVCNKTYTATFTNPAFAKQTKEVPATGWVDYEGARYCCGDDGKPIANKFYKVGEFWYRFDADGVMLHGGFIKVNKYWYYFGTDGAIAMGWLTLEQPDGTVKTYYCGSNGVVRFKWQKIEGKYYYFGKNGVMRANGFKKINNKYYYFTADGSILIGGFRKVNGKWYYFNKNGTVAFGWKKIGKKTYYCGNNGVVRFKWQKISGKYYYFGTNGVMLYSTSKKIDGKTYKFNSKGVCQNKK